MPLQSDLSYRSAVPVNLYPQAKSDFCFGGTDFGLWTGKAGLTLEIVSGDSYAVQSVSPAGLSHDSPYLAEHVLRSTASATGLVLPPDRSGIDCFQVGALRFYVCGAGWRCEATGVTMQGPLAGSPWHYDMTPPACVWLEPKPDKRYITDLDYARSYRAEIARRVTTHNPALRTSVAELRKIFP